MQLAYVEDLLSHTLLIRPYVAFFQAWLFLAFRVLGRFLFFLHEFGSSNLVTAL